MAEGRNVRRTPVEVLHAHVALGQPAHHHFFEGADFELVGGAEFDLVLVQDNLGVAALEVEAIGQLLLGLVDGVLDLHRVHFGDNIE